VRKVGLGFKIWNSELAVPVFAENGGFCWRQQNRVKCLGTVADWELDRQVRFSLPHGLQIGLR